MKGNPTVVRREAAPREAILGMLQYFGLLTGAGVDQDDSPGGQHLVDNFPSIMRPTIRRSAILTRPFRFTAVGRHDIQSILLILKFLKDDLGAIGTNLRRTGGSSEYAFLACLKILQQKVIDPSVSQLVPVSRNGWRDIPIGAFSNA